MSEQARDPRTFKAAVTIFLIIFSIPMTAAFSHGAPPSELIAGLKNDDPSVRESSAASLGATRDAAAVGPLIAALDDNDWYVRRAAATALGKIGKPATEPLKALLKEESLTLRVLAVLALSEADDVLAERVLDDLAKTDGIDLQATAKGYALQIRKGENGTEWPLILALFRHGDKQMAEDFINSGNHLLSAAAQRWTNGHGLQIIPYSVARQGPMWGSR